MNWLDLFLLCIILLSVISSFRWGFARVVVNLVAAVAAILCGLWLYGAAGALFIDYVASREVANLCGFILVFVGILLLGAVTGKVFAMLFKWTGLSWLDRLLGAGVGVVRGLLIATAIIMAIIAFSPKAPPRAVVESKVAPYVVDACSEMVALAPREVKDAFNASYLKIKKFWQGAVKQDVPAVLEKDKK